MKKIIVFLVGLLLISGCSDVLDVKDLSNYNPDNVWNDIKLTEACLTNLYPGVLGGWPRDGGNADECLGIMGPDAIQVNNASMKFWPYATIRNINLLLQQIETGTLSQAEKDPIIGQALFLRAFLYFKMIMYHGGVPIVREPQSLTDDLMVSRNSTAECFDFIVSDLDDAARRLPVRYTGGDYGRIDQCAVAAFKGRVLLFKASPQFNPGNYYDNSYWTEAFNATKAAYDLLTANGYGLVDNYTDVFETERHQEAVLAVVYTNPSKTNGRGEDAVRPLSESKNATGGDQPAWNFAEAFPMKDGRKIGESSKYAYDVQTYWLNRDPRFDQTIVYNGSVYELSARAGRRQYTVPNIAASMDAFGYNIQGEWHARTGLYTKKGMQEELNVAQVTLNDVDWLEIRFAEVMFNYAEAANEKGDRQAGYDVLTAIRRRAGIEPGDDNLYGLQPGMSREEMRTALMDEKRIEFCFEGKRFWDLRRHRLLHNYLNGMHKYGILASLKDHITLEEAMTKAQTFDLLPEDFKYEAVDTRFQNPNSPDAMSTPESYYFFPIHNDEIQNNANLEQNKDWGGNFDPALR
ncbi:MAG: RagB/SusD family nutrient uptake outer membrane protein [Tannerella sp.]|jgi:hypothetical protein|nr:RagB/SusD family nutrient uptake outer membrane protein [Tannerella sp.]